MPPCSVPLMILLFRGSREVDVPRRSLLPFSAGVPLRVTSGAHDPYVIVGRMGEAVRSPIAPAEPVRARPRTIDGRRARAAVKAGLATSRLSRGLRLGSGMIIGGRVTAALCPSALARLADGRRIILVTGTNGKTTTSYLIAAALRTIAPVAHNDTGANMADGALAALMHDQCSPLVVLEADELHLPAIAAATSPEVVVALNLSRDQLDRAREVRGTAAALGRVGVEHADATVVSNADDPLLVSSLAGRSGRTIWVAGGGRWTADGVSCPRCGARISRTPGPAEWRCECGLRRPVAHWAVRPGGIITPRGYARLEMRLPGRFNAANGLAAIAVADHMGVDIGRAASAVEQVTEIGGRYRVRQMGRRRVRLLLAKNPAGWAETVAILGRSSAVIVAINAREADGRDVSWLWDVAFEDLRGRHVAAAGDRAADVGVRLSYAEVPHDTVCDALAAVTGSPEGDVDIVADYTSFRALSRRLDDPRELGR